MMHSEWTRRSLLRVAQGGLLAAAAGSALASPAAASPAPFSGSGGSRGEFEFVHPGLLHSAADLERMKAGVQAKEEPIYPGFLALAAHPRSSLDYRIQNTGQISSWGRGPTNFMGQAVSDSCAAYQQALMWAVTGDLRYADKARDILNVWSTTLKAITGADGQLGSGLQGFKFANAAEILRYSGYGGWAAADIARCEGSLKAVWYQSFSGYALFANGNWDVAALQTVMAIGVFCNDRVMFEDAVRYAAAGPGNGRLENIVVNETGQGQESGRSQAYAQLAIGLLTNAAEVAWNQGVDLYGHADNRILKAYEYNSRYNLGWNDVPFVADLDRTGKYIKTAISPNNRAQFQPIYEVGYAHYVSRMGLEAPHTKQVVFRGAGGSRSVEGTNDDHPGFGTLTHAQPASAPSEPSAAPRAPSGLTATSAPSGVVVSWVEAVDPGSRTLADSYTVQRATSPAGPYAPIATGVTSSSYTDRTARSVGDAYYYTVTAVNAAGESPPSLPVVVTAGLPASWATRDVGEVATAGTTTFDGRTFTVEASGTEIGGTLDAFRFTYVPMLGDGEVTARVVYPVSSQYATVGVMMRQTPDADSAHASMLIKGLPLHTWSGVWTTRDSAGATTTGTGSTPVPPTQAAAISINAGFPISNLGSLPESATPLAAPYVEAASDGYRMRMPYWVRVVRRSDVFTGYISGDGSEWTEVGSSEIAFGNRALVGLAVCSALGVPEVYRETTTAAFDNVSVPGWTVPTPPAAPAGALRAEAGASAVDLAWSDLDLSARYTVKRSTVSGGPYEVIAAGVGPVGFGVEARYSDAIGVPGTTYHYVVAATNVAGEGPHSAEASATMPVPPLPQVTSRTQAFADVGVPFEYLISGSNDPTSFSATGLPAGLTLDPATGIISGTPSSEGTAQVEVSVQNASGAGSTTVVLAVGQAPPAPWSYTDIGDYVLDERQLGVYSAVAIQTPGSTSHDAASGRFTVRGAGTDLNVIGQGMTVQFAHLPVTGDATIVARVVSRENAGTADRVGLIMSKTLSPFDHMAGAILTSKGTGDAGVKQFVRRQKVAGGFVTTDGAAGVGVPTWLKLERVGNTFTAWTSPDGQAWTPIAPSDEIAAFGDAPYHVGLAVVSREPLELNTTVFDNVSVS